MKLWEQVGVDVNSERFCIDCTPISADQAEKEGIGGPVLAQDIQEDEQCGSCGKILC